MSDFIREVDEDYRRERAANFLKRYQVHLAALVVLIVAGAGGWRWYSDHRTAVAAAADARYQAAQEQARDGKTAEAEKGFRDLAADAPGGYVILARLRAAEVLGLKDPEAAAKQLDAIASDEGAGAAALRDLARYRSALLRLDVQDPKAFETQYGRFALEGFTFHDGMRESLALAAMKRGDLPAARKYLDDIAMDPLAPPGLRNRAQAFRELVNAGPATAIPSAPGPAAVTPLAGGPSPIPQFDTIAPVETLPPNGGPPSGGPTAAAPAPPPLAPGASEPPPLAPVPSPPPAPEPATPPAPAEK